MIWIHICIMPIARLCLRMKDLIAHFLRLKTNKHKLWVLTFHLLCNRFRDLQPVLHKKKKNRNANKYMSWQRKSSLSSPNFKSTPTPKIWVALTFGCYHGHVCGEALLCRTRNYNSIVRALQYFKAAWNIKMFFCKFIKHSRWTLSKSPARVSRDAVGAGRLIKPTGSWLSSELLLLLTEQRACVQPDSESSSSPGAYSTSISLLDFPSRQNLTQPTHKQQPPK